MTVRLAGTFLALLMMVPLWLCAQDTAATPPTRRETVRVLLPDGVTPAAAATYFVHTLDERWEKQGTTNGAGRATIEYPTKAPAQFHVIALEGTARVDLRKGEAGDRSVTLAPYRTVEGHVYTEDRKPVPGAAVQYSVEAMEQLAWSGNRHDSRQTTTDHSGFFKFDHLEDGHGRIGLVRRGHEGVPKDWMNEYLIPKALEWAYTPEEPGRTVELILTKGTVLSGSVVDDKGRPVGGARVQLDGPSDASGETTTGADGRFTFPGLPAAGVCRMAASGEGFEQLKKVTVDLAKPSGITIPLSRKESAIFDVRDPSGRPVQRIVYTNMYAFFPPITDPPPGDSIKASTDGRYPYLHRKDDRESFVVRDADHKPGQPVAMALQSVNFGDLQAGGVIPVRLRPVYPVTGRVVTTPGSTGMPDVQIYISPRSVAEMGGLPEAPARPLAVSGGDGYFRCAPVPAGEVFVHAFSPHGFQLEEYPLTIMEALPPPQVEIVMVPAVRLRLHWRTGADRGGAPFSLTSNRPCWHMPPSKSSSVVYAPMRIALGFDANGLFEEDGLLPGDWTFSRQSGTWPSTLTLRVPASPTAELTVP